MLTKKVIKIKKEYSELFLVADTERGSVHEKKFAAAIWRELIDNCRPTRKEFNKITNYILVTPEVFYLIMKKAGFWTD